MMNTYIRELNTCSILLFLFVHLDEMTKLTRTWYIPMHCSFPTIVSAQPASSSPTFQLIQPRIMFRRNL